MIKGPSGDKPKLTHFSSGRTSPFMYCFMANASQASQSHGRYHSASQVRVICIMNAGHCHYGGRYAQQQHSQFSAGPQAASSHPTCKLALEVLDYADLLPSGGLRGRPLTNCCLHIFLPTFTAPLEAQMMDQSCIQHYIWKISLASQAAGHDARLSSAAGAAQSRQSATRLQVRSTAM